LLQNKKKTDDMEIRRSGERVVLTIDLADQYDAMMVYDKLLAQARKGFILLDVEGSVTIRSGEQRIEQRPGRPL